MNRARRLGRVGGLVVSVAAAAPFVYLWVQSMRGADDPLTLRARLGMAIWIAVFAIPLDARGPAAVADLVAAGRRRAVGP